MTVGPAAYLGMNVAVREQTSIGPGATVGMGAVVVDDLPAGEIWAGVPARPLPRHDDVGAGGPMKVPLVDLAAQQREIADEVRAGLDEVFAASAFIGGPQVAAFEQEYARFVGVAHCVGVANGTDALELALRAAGVTRRGRGRSSRPTRSSRRPRRSRRIGALPVLVDVDPSTC